MEKKKISDEKDSLSPWAMALVEKLKQSVTLTNQDLEGPLVSFLKDPRKTPIEVLDYRLVDLLHNSVPLPIEKVERPLAVLGIAPSIVSKIELKGKIESESAYGRLPRPASLPSVPFPFSAESGEVQAILRKFWDGDFCFETKETDDDDDIEIGDFYIKAWTRDDPMTLNVTIKVTRTDTFFSYNIAPRHVLVDKSLKTLALRALHLIFRQYGFMLCKRWRHAIFDLVDTGYHRIKKNLVAKLDLRLTRLDLLHNLSNDSQERYIGIISVSNVLNVSRPLTVSAALLQESVSVFSIKDPQYASLLYAYAAGLYSTTEKHDDALTCCVKAARLHGKLFWMSHAKQEQDYLLQQTLDTCFRMELEAARFRIRAEKKVLSLNEKLSQTLLLLMSFANILPKDDSSGESFYQSLLSSKGIISWRKHMKHKYTVTKAAMNLLVKAFDSGTVIGFREKILSALKPKEILGDTDPMPGESEEERITDNRNYVRKMRCRMHPRTTREKCRHCDRLENWANKGRTEVFMTCPCAAACYCTTLCQEKDWKAHKKNCSWYKEKKKSTSHSA